MSKRNTTKSGEISGIDDTDDENYLTPTYARSGFTRPLNLQSIPEGWQDPREVQQLLINRINLDARNSSDFGNYVCDHMDPECDEIIMKTLGKNYIDQEAYQQTSALGSAIPVMNKNPRRKRTGYSLCQTLK